jgi:signal transduction histidine kinase
VWDTGPGIPPEDRDAVMRRFYRVDRSRHLPGTGLGLSLVAAIARLHGLTLEIGAHQGGGCAVTMEAGDPA